MLSHESLQNLIFINFQLAQHHKYSITELENMLPFERDIYVSLLEGYLEEEAQRRQNGG